MSELVEETHVFGELRLSLLRPSEPYELIDEEAFADDEFIPYWSELWPSALLLARALPERLDGRGVLELGAGLGLPSLVAAARGAEVTALDWAAEAVELLRRNARRNGIELTALHGDWRTISGSYDLVVGADLLYESRNAEALLRVLPTLGREVLLAEPGRPHAAEFFRLARTDWLVQEAEPRVYRLTR